MTTTLIYDNITTLQEEINAAPDGEIIVELPNVTPGMEEMQSMFLTMAVMERVNVSHAVDGVRVVADAFPLVSQNYDFSLRFVKN